MSSWSALRPHSEQAEPYTRHDYDSAIESRAVENATVLAQEYGDSEDPFRIAQVQCLRALLSHNYLQSDSAWIATDTLHERLRDRLGEEFNDQKLRYVVGSFARPRHSHSQSACGRIQTANL